jgi:hypothetical protein
MSASRPQKGGVQVTKARLFHLSVVACLIVFALMSAMSYLPDSMFDGAD